METEPALLLKRVGSNLSHQAWTGADTSRSTIVWMVQGIACIHTILGLKCASDEEIWVCSCWTLSTVFAGGFEHLRLLFLEEPLDMRSLVIVGCFFQHVLQSRNDFHILL